MTVPNGAGVLHSSLDCCRTVAVHIFPLGAILVYFPCIPPHGFESILVFSISPATLLTRKLSFRLKRAPTESLEYKLSLEYIASNPMDIKTISMAEIEDETSLEHSNRIRLLAGRIMQLGLLLWSS